LSAYWWFSHGYLLYYGDAQAHLNISRSIIDSRTPGYRQLGNVWLPILHVICLPWVRDDWLWTTGLAGTIPVALCFLISGVGFYFAAKETYHSATAASVVVCCFALNPNVLYLASIPMTEIVFLAGLAVLLMAALYFRRTRKRRFLILGIVASCTMSLTRYDGWFLIPFAAAWFALSARYRHWRVLAVFALSASLAPLYWLAHNWWETGDALDFFNGPYSARAIQGGRSYPGYHDWKLASVYYAAAGQLCAGWCLSFLGVVGVFCAAIKKAVLPSLFLLLTPVLYIWSIHSSWTPIFVPQLWPHSYYNSRYGIAVVAFAAFAAGAIVLVLPVGWRKIALLVPLVSIAPWLATPSRENWICWKESQVNSVARRAWTEAGAEFVRANYHAGEGILTPPIGDVTGVFSRAMIPISETLHEGNGPSWYATTLRSDLLHQEAWAIAQSGDYLSNAIGGSAHPGYRLTTRIQIQGAPALEIYRRKDPLPHGRGSDGDAEPRAAASGNGR
jgi:hypothetical protein